MIQSPCVKVCVMDPARGICAGCGRTLDEIARWGSMSHGEREEIMQSLKARLSLGPRASSPHDAENITSAARMAAVPGRTT